MSAPHFSTRAWVAAVTLAHLIVSIVHGQAHTRAQVPLSPAANAFVLIVIVVGPLLGLALLWWAARTGAALIAVTLVASFVFGMVNHFVLVSPDHVAHVTETVRPIFTVTAVLLALTEAAGSVLAARLARRRRLEPSSPFASRAGA